MIHFAFHEFFPLDLFKLSGPPTEFQEKHNVKFFLWNWKFRMNGSYFFKAIYLPIHFPPLDSHSVVSLVPSQTLKSLIFLGLESNSQRFQVSWSNRGKAKYLIGVILDPVLSVYKFCCYKKILLQSCAISRNSCFNNSNNNNNN